MVHKVCVAILTAGLVFAQTFEVASVRPATAKDPRLVSTRGGPGATDPTHYRAVNYPLIRLVCEGYSLQLFQITYPDWMFFTRFAIAANVPAGATKKDLRVMLQQLLAERFKLRTHGEHKLMEVYALTVSKGGPKFKKSAEPADEDSESQDKTRQRWLSDATSRCHDHDGRPGTNERIKDIDALEKQLGLKLQSKKVMVEKLVIDHADKLPTEN